MNIAEWTIWITVVAMAGLIGASVREFTFRRKLRRASEEAYEKGYREGLAAAAGEGL